MGRTRTKHRIFFALKPDHDTRRGIRAVQRRLGRAKGRMVPADRLHATLLFLGNQTEERLHELQEIASGIEFPACRLTLDRFGHFPRAAVGWLGPTSVPPELEAFQERLSRAVAAAGIDFDERPWRMHVTLYRNLRKRPETIDFEPVEWPLREFQLLESVQDQSGLSYQCRGRWPA